MRRSAALKAKPQLKKNQPTVGTCCPGAATITAFSRCIDVCRSWIDVRRSDVENRMAQAIAADIAGLLATAEQSGHSAGCGLGE